jgi:hypothetical protein
VIKMIGRIYSYSYGYDMTIQVYCKVIEERAKTVKAVEISHTVENDDGKGMGRSYPLPDKFISGPFLLYKRVDRSGRVYLAGRGHHWHENNGQGDYYNTWD